MVRVFGVLEDAEIHLGVLFSELFDPSSFFLVEVPDVLQYFPCDLSQAAKGFVMVEDPFENPPNTEKAGKLKIDQGVCPCEPHFER